MHDGDKAFEALRARLDQPIGRLGYAVLDLLAIGGILAMGFAALRLAQWLGIIIRFVTR